MVAVLKYKKTNIYHKIYIKVFPDGAVSNLTVSTYDFMNTANNVAAFAGLRKLFREEF